MKEKKKCLNILGKTKRVLSKNHEFYTYDHPKDIIIFNAFIVTKKQGILWNGDLNLTKDHYKLVKLQKNIGNFYVFHQSAIIDSGVESFYFNRSFCFYDESGFKPTEELDFISLKKGTPYKKKIKLTRVYSYISFFEDKKDLFQTIKIPNLNSLFNEQATNFETWEIFKNKLKEIHGEEFVKNQFLKLYLTQDDYLKIKKYSLKRLKLKHKKKHPIELNRLSILEELNHAPFKFDKKISWAKNGFGYLKK